MCGRRESGAVEVYLNGTWELKVDGMDQPADVRVPDSYAGQDQLWSRLTAVSSERSVAPTSFNDNNRRNKDSFLGQKRPRHRKTIVPGDWRPHHNLS